MPGECIPQGQEPPPLLLSYSHRPSRSAELQGKAEGILDGLGRAGGKPSKYLTREAILQGKLRSSKRERGRE